MPHAPRHTGHYWRRLVTLLTLAALARSSRRRLNASPPNVASRRTRAVAKCTACAGGQSQSTKSETWWARHRYDLSKDVVIGIALLCAALWWDQRLAGRQQDFEVLIAAQQQRIEDARLVRQVVLDGSMPKIFEEMDLREARLTGLTFECDSSIIGLQPYCTSFYKANLRDAYFNSSYLDWVYFGGANLAGADLSDTELGGANFSGATLTGADFDGACYDGDTVWPGGRVPSGARRCMKAREPA